MRTITSSALALIISGALIFSPAATAQDVLLKISTTLGEAKPVASERKVTAGSEVEIHSGAMYRIMLKTAVVSPTRAQFTCTVFEAASGAIVSVSTAMSLMGQKARFFRGSAAPSPGNLLVEVTPSL